MTWGGDARAAVSWDGGGSWDDGWSSWPAQEEAAWHGADASWRDDEGGSWQQGGWGQAPWSRSPPASRAGRLRRLDLGRPGHRRNS